MAMTTEQAVLHLREDPRWEHVMRDSYLDEDTSAAARRFEASGEFAAVRAIVGDRLPGATVLDLGAGTGIASRALSRAGAARVVALEPDPSPVIGRGAIARVCEGLPGVLSLSGYGEQIPLAEGVVDVVYARQVLHHARDLPGLLRECARVLRPGGLLLATREHVVDGPEQLRAFLDYHPVHQLAGGENAFSLGEYLDAIGESGLHLIGTLGPWDSVINAFPAVQADTEIPGFARSRFLSRWGVLGRLALALPGAERRARRSLERPEPGRLYSFLCERPPDGLRRQGA